MRSALKIVPNFGGLGLEAVERLKMLKRSLENRGFAARV